MAKRTVKDRWTGFSYAREARALEDSLRQLVEASNRAYDLVRKARATWRQDWARPAKDLVLDAHGEVSRAVGIGDLTEHTAGPKIDALPNYGSSDHVFSQARAVREAQAKALAQAEVLKRELSAASVGDPSHVKERLDRLIERSR